MSASDPFQQFSAVFFEECQELIADMEQHLSDLQSGSGDDETLNAIFRAVHSIKAGAGALNFEQLVGYSHTFEASLDKLRSGEAECNQDVVDVLYQAYDVLVDLVKASEDGREIPPEDVDEAATLLQEVIGAPHKPIGRVPEGMKPEPVFDKDTVFDIDFAPSQDVFRSANEPLLLLRELRTLGELQVHLDISALPPLHHLEPEDSYFKWNLTLTTSHSEDDVREVFEFVEDECDLTIKPRGAGGAGGAKSQSAFAPVGSRRKSDQPEADDDDGFGLFEDAMAAIEEAASGPRPSIAPANNGAFASTAKPSGNKVANSAGAKATADGEDEQNAQRKVSSIRVDLERVDRLVNMVGELVITQAMLMQELQSLEPAQRSRLAAGTEILASHTRELQENVMSIRMQPVKSVFSRMPRVVRDLSKQLGKKVNLVMIGEATEVDKTVIEEIADPLTHMIRNSLDHGIESVEERRKAGKPEEGTIKLRAEHRGGRIIIEIEDDGKGIPTDKILAKAIEKGLVRADAKLSEDEVVNLIFHPGFSTAEQVTNVSGRGVGMDVVRKNIQALGGRISVQTETGKGSCFTLALPLTLAVLDGMIVGVGAQKYVVPVSSIMQSIRPIASDVRTLVGGSQLVRVRGQYIPLIHLGDIFNVEDAVTDPTKAIVVIVDTELGDHIGLVVDELLGQQQVVIKSLESNFQHIAGVSAATILGNGQVCLIADIDGLEEIERRRRGQLVPSQFVEANRKARAANTAEAGAVDSTSSSKTSDAARSPSAV